MPSDISASQHDLLAVDTTRKPANHRATNTHYVFPEPALLASAEDPRRRQLALHHFTMIRDALLYRLGDADASHAPLSSQEWRDVSHGKLTPQRPRNSKSRQRSSPIYTLLGPVMCAYGTDELHNFPADPDTIPLIPTNKAKGII
ncbi:hypothetical protein C8R43DRAFT_367884 [Mycena crocata]|nr:hypothetical protein C8R43DRAFT_367884 [Mycena crocata]